MFLFLTSFLFSLYIDSSPGSIELDDLNLKPFSCNSVPITCTFSSGFCGWKGETTRNNLLWALGIGRVRDPTKLKDRYNQSINTILLSSQTVLYTDFTVVTQGLSSMELQSEIVDVPPKGGACVSMEFRLKYFSTDSSLNIFQLLLININGMYWRKYYYYFK